MERITAAEIAGAVGGALRGDGAASAVSTDSRSVAPGSLFVPLTGERFDGHDYMDAALERGAAGWMCARLPARPRADRFYITVPDTRLALKALAAWYRDRFAIPFVQITGSVGKTTTKEMVAAVLREHCPTLATEGNFNNDIGVPLTLFRLDRTCAAAVIETGMNHFGEIRYLGEMVRPDFALITNIGDAHMEYLGSREGILRAKAEIFENLRPGGVAVLNGDDPLLNTLALPFETVRCGRGENCDVRIRAARVMGVKGIDCTVATGQAVYPLHIPALGAHMVYPAAMAAAVGERLGLTPEEIIRGVAAYRPAGSRMWLLRSAGGCTILDDCYNANPQSMEAALRILGEEEGTMAVLGDMGELGELSSQAHRQVGALAKALGIGRLVAVGPRSRDMAEAARGMDVRWFPDVDGALAALPGLAEGARVVLVKASHAMNFHRIVEKLQEL